LGTGAVFGVVGSSPSGNAVYGYTDGGYAIYGYNAGGGTGLAAFFYGNVSVDVGCLKVDGNLVSGTCLSDGRLKQKIEPLTGALERLVRLRGVTFEWKNPARQGERPGAQAGFIAQDVEEVFPNWVGQNEEGFKTLDVPIRELQALEVEAFKTLKAENDALKAKSDKQQAQIDKLTSAVEKLQRGKDPISGGPGFGPGVLALVAAGLSGATGLMLKRMGLSLATVVGLLIAGRKRSESGKKS
jgi:hypothetical protein